MRRLEKGWSNAGLVHSHMNFALAGDATPHSLPARETDER